MSQFSLHQLARARTRELAGDRDLVRLVSLARATASSALVETSSSTPPGRPRPRIVLEAQAAGGR